MEYRNGQRHGGENVRSNGLCHQENSGTVGCPNQPAEGVCQEIRR